MDVKDAYERMNDLYIIYYSISRALTPDISTAAQHKLEAVKQCMDILAEECPEVKEKG